MPSWEATKKLITEEGEKSCKLSHFMSRLLGLVRKNINESERGMFESKLKAACELFQQKSAFFIFIGGCSGVGKSTLSSLLSTSLGITKIVSTDVVRQVLRDSSSQQDHPFLFCSTYNAFELVKATELTTKHEDVVIDGFSRQSDLLCEKLESLLCYYESKGESVIVEGVHLLEKKVFQRLCQGRSTIIPFLITLADKDEHKKRLSSRVRDNAKNKDISKPNKYIQNFENISIIQNHLYDFAEKHQVNKRKRTVFEFFFFFFLNKRLQSSIT
jgi:2-phosphoglycerate kinase